MNSTLKFFGFSTPKKEESLAESTAVLSTTQNDVLRAKRRMASPLTSKNQQKMKIESHVLTDAQSSGIVSRLVKYYDQSQNDAAERSRIVYNKVGDFPLVQLKKSEIKRSFSKSTSVRIAPPNKTIMNRDLRAQIMRSNSFQFSSGIPKIQPVKMRAKDDSHKIITNHEESYTVSSNSVLDALEKNCRKRINNEELILDRNKKFCSPIAPAPYDYGEGSNAPQNSTAPLSAKRTREQISPIKKGPSFDLQQRKKFRTRNNALLSSLSSSHHELIPTSPPSSPHLNQTKVIPKTSLAQLPIVKISPENEKTQIEVEKKKKSEEKEVVDCPQEQSKVQADVPKKLQLFNRKPDPNAISNRAKFRLYDSDDEDEVHIKFVKPKEQVIEGSDDRKQLEKAKLARMIDCLTKGTETPFKPKEKPKDMVDAVKPSETQTTQSAAISFSTSTTTSTAAPISSAGSTLVTASIVKDVQTSTKSGGFQLSTGISLLPKPDDKKSEPASSIQLPTTNAAIPQLPTVVTSSENNKVISPQTSLTTSGGIQFNFNGAQTTGSNPLLPSKTSVTFGTLPATSIKPQESDKPTLPVIGSFLTSTSSSEKPSLGGFQFGSSVSTSTNSQPTSTLTISSSLPISKPVSPLALFSTSANSTITPMASKIETVQTTTASGIGFSFGGTKSTISGITPISSVTSTASNPSVSFNFGAKQDVPVTASPSFNFGKNATITAQKTQVETKPSFSFGANSLAPMPSFAKPEAPKSSFSFGNSTQPSSSTPATPVFGQQSSSNISAPVTTTTSGFNFGATNTSVTSGNNFGQLTSTPSFSSLNNVPSTAPPSFSTFSAPVNTSSNSIFANSNANVSAPQQAAPVFGGFNANPNSSFTSNTPQPTFGQLNEAAPKSSFSFGTSNAAPPAALSSASTNIFGSSQAQPSAKQSFNFGSSITAQPSFGGINSAPSQENKAAFNFMSSSNTSNTFGSQTAPSSAPIFGTTHSPFGSSQESQKQAFNFNNQNSSFNFNKPQETPSPFGNVHSQQSNENKSFNFGQATPQLPQLSPAPPNNTAQNAQGGIFSIGTAGQQQRKPFRTATRRLK